MNSEGQVYFNADDEEIPDEDIERLSEAEEVEDLLRAIRKYEAEQARDQQRRDRELTLKQQEHENRLSARRQRLAEQARIYAEAQEVDGQGEQEEE